MSGRNSRTAIHVLALDGIVNVNSLFTVALFLGLASNPPNPAHALVSSRRCVAASSVAERLVSCHVYSFTCFLFSSLVASALKQAIKVSSSSSSFTAASGDMGSSAALVLLGHIDSALLRAGILASAAGSVVGCAFLTLALIDLVQLKLGLLACRSLYGLAAVAPLVFLVPSALIIYVCLVLYAFTH